LARADWKRKVESASSVAMIVPSANAAIGNDDAPLATRFCVGVARSVQRAFCTTSGSSSDHLAAALGPSGATVRTTLPFCTISM
jgi:hypothetical protein